MWRDVILHAVRKSTRKTLAIKTYVQISWSKQCTCLHHCLPTLYTSSLCFFLTNTSLGLLNSCLFVKTLLVLDFTPAVNYWSNKQRWSENYCTIYRQSLVETFNISSNLLSFLTKVPHTNAGNSKRAKVSSYPKEELGHAHPWNVNTTHSSKTFFLNVGPP